MAKSNYIQLNLQTKDQNLREYLDRKSVEASVEAGERVTVTKYIQDLILNDMENEDINKQRKDELSATIKESIDKLDVKQLVLIGYLIKGLQK